MDDIVKMLASDLSRIKDGQDETNKRLIDINERLASLEIKITVLEKLGDDVEKLKAESNKGIGVKQVAAWLITTGIAIYSYFRQ